MLSQDVIFSAGHKLQQVTTAAAFPGCRFVGPALPGAFADTGLLRELERAGLWPPPGADPLLTQRWRSYRQGLDELQGPGSEIRVRIRVLLPLVKALGYHWINEARPVRTARGNTHGGYVLSGEGPHLRAFCAVLGADLDAPSQGPHERAQAALAATKEKIGLLTNGRELLVLLPEASHVALPLGDHAGPNPPPWYLLLHGLCASRALRRTAELLALVQHRRALQQHREQVPRALEGFLHFLIIHPANHRQMFDLLHGTGDPALLQALFQEGACLVSGLLIALARGDAADGLWALGPRARALVATDGRSERSHCKGASLEQVLRELLGTGPGGAPPAEALAPTLSGLRWGDRAAAYLIDGLLGGQEDGARARHEAISLGEAIALGEALAELEPNIATEPLYRVQQSGQKREEIPPGRLYLRRRGRTATASPAPAAPP